MLARQGGPCRRGRVMGLRRACRAQESDEGVALESCEFWSAFCEASVEPEVLGFILGFS